MHLSKQSSANALFAPGLLYIAFNQDEGCFAIATEAGFRVYNTNPLKEKTRREFSPAKVRAAASQADGGSGTGVTAEESGPSIFDSSSGGLGIVEMLHRTNYLALVGGGKNPRFPPNKVMIWDDLKARIIIELEFKSDIKAVKLTKDRIIVVLLNRVFIYTLSATPQMLHNFETSDNERGLVAVSAVSGAGGALVAFPGRSKGQIQIIKLPKGLVWEGAVLSAPVLSIIPAHNTYIQQLALSHTGHLLATASETGTLLRVFDTHSGRLLHEFRRGADKAEIYCISFNAEGTRLCTASDKGTVHIFNLAQGSIPGSPAASADPSVGDRSLSSSQNSPRAAPPSSPSASSASGGASSSSTGNRQSSLSFLSPYLPKYFSSEWSFGHFSLPTESKCLCTFIVDDLEAPRSTTAPGAEIYVLALCADGSAYKFSLDARKGGEGQRESYYRFYSTH
ncbi:putative Wdr45l protein [Polychytrium aggregatum]|uniref:putative Wdr45l protein n=1 Tax=Polychytrium aggregatum TaxID=110093 RepID=UPI0022FE4F85|nr:putative Wdr45l protein [Polychytrium aggregatum]KAI9207133.1 putative Wdr45l protein [Polychytrium aggregatum]